MIPLLLLIPLLVANTTVQLPVPISVHVNEPGGGGGAVAVPGLDVATITGLVGTAGAFVYRWKQSNKRQIVGTETQGQVADSLKKTDVGVNDFIATMAQAADHLPIPDDLKKSIKDQASAWNKDIEAYYDKTTSKPYDLSNDPVIRKQGEIQKVTEPTTTD
jgi:hypothetical protein